MVLGEQDTNVQRRIRKEGQSQRGCLRSTRLGVVVHMPLVPACTRRGRHISWSSVPAGLHRILGQPGPRKVKERDLMHTGLWGPEEGYKIPLQLELQTIVGHYVGAGY